jgi:hypothetical protein
MGTQFQSSLFLKSARCFIPSRQSTTFRLILYSENKPENPSLYQISARTSTAHKLHVFHYKGNDLPNYQHLCLLLSVTEDSNCNISSVSRQASLFAADRTKGRRMGALNVGMKEMKVNNY